MVVKLADDMVTPLALGTEANYEAIRRGLGSLRRHEALWQLSMPCVASCMEPGVLEAACAAEHIGQEYTRFERMCLLATVRALRQAGVDARSPRTLFVLSTTKGNVHLLDARFTHHFAPQRVTPAASAQAVAQWFGNSRTPLVVCNACISGLHAQLLAARLIEQGSCDTVVVTGADMLSPFIVSGFQSLLALSPEPCRPFDEERIGLNLGEAAACVVYGRAPQTQDTRWQLCTGAVCNDAYHISAPSRTAEGYVQAVQNAMHGAEPSELAFVCAHGTATLYNDEMEAVGLTRAGLQQVPVCSFKGYFGHTMGAAGVVETLLSMQAIDHGMVPATKGYACSGVSRRLLVSGEWCTTTQRAFLKTISGFGGCNAAVLFRKGGVA